MTDPTRTRANSATHRPLRLLASVLIAVATALLGLTAASPSAYADGTSGSTDSGTGWIRLTHLSPDTPAVDVRLTSLSDSKWSLKLDDVSYGDVSTYEKAPAGRYVAAMTPAGGNASSKPVITQSVTIRKDYAYTVAAIGKNADLKGIVLNDDLRSPKAGQAKVRLIQASTNAPDVTVTAMGGPVLARNAAFGSTTGYASVEAGLWTVNVDPAAGSSAETTSLKVPAAAGSVSTIVLLNGANGSVEGKVLKDAGGTAKAPKKGTGVNTGGGGAATQFVTDDPQPAQSAVSQAAMLGGAGAVVAALAAVVLVRVRRRQLAVAPRRSTDG